MPTVKKKERDDTKNVRTITSVNPFCSNDNKIINFMGNVSKQIYNSSIFCHKIYNLYSKHIYFKLQKYCESQAFELESLNEFMFITYDTYYNQYIKNIIHIKAAIKLIWSYVNSNNKTKPIVNENYDDYYYLTYCYLNSKIDITIEIAEIIESEINNAVNWTYAFNFKRAKDEIYNKIPCTITDPNFIAEVKCNNFKFKKVSTINYKKIIEQIVNERTKSEFKFYSNQYIVKLLTTRHIDKLIDLIPRDVIYNIIDKAYEGHKSFMSLKAKGIKSNAPNFLAKGAKYILPYTTSSRKMIKMNNENYVRINVGSYIAKNYIQIVNSKSLKGITDKKYVDIKFLKDKYDGKKSQYIKIDNSYIKKNHKKIIQGNYIYIRIPDKLLNKKIGQIEICPQYDGYQYKVCFTYQRDEVKLIEYDTKNQHNYCFIDLGIKNLMAIYDPSNSTQRLLSGYQLLSINSFYNKRVDDAKSKLPKGVFTSNKIRDLLIKREAKIMKYMDDVCNWIVKTYSNKKCIVAGYNKKWKNNIKMGNVMNRKFYEVPYSTLLKKLKEKLSVNGKEFKTIRESYTSKCDSLAHEEICKHTTYLGERVSRDLFYSSKNKILNADINAAINIGSLYMKKMNGKVTIFEQCVLNPIKIRKINVSSEGPK